MKWSSKCMIRAYKLLILSTALVLVIIGILAGNSGSSIPFSGVFLAIIFILMLVLFWNSFDAREDSSKNLQSSPGVISYDSNQNEVDITDLTNQNSIPNPLDSDIDIPLM